VRENRMSIGYGLRVWIGGSKGNETASSIGVLKEPSFEHMAMHLLKLRD